MISRYLEPWSKDPKPNRTMSKTARPLKTLASATGWKGGLAVVIHVKRVIIDPQTLHYTDRTWYIMVCARSSWPLYSALKCRG